MSTPQILSCIKMYYAIIPQHNLTMGIEKDSLGFNLGGFVYKYQKLCVIDSDSNLIF